MSAAVRIIPEGAGVYTADGEKVGQAREHEADYLHVQHGRLLGADDDYYFPAHIIARVDEAGGRVELALTKAEVDARDWSVPPPPSTVPERPVAGAASPVAASSAAGPGDRADERTVQPAADTPAAARVDVAPDVGMAAGRAAAREPASAGLRADMAVIGSDGRAVGRVKEVQAGEFLVDRPRQRDVYVPRAAVRDLTAGEVLLNVPADQIDAMGWATPPLG